MKKGVYFSYAQAGYATVSLAGATAAYANSIRYSATGDSGALSGGLAQSGLYQTSSGWIAVAALETVFVERLKKILNLAEIDRKSLSAVFLTRSVQAWEDWGREHDVPIAVVANLGQ